MSRRLASYVIVHGPDGASASFGPDDDVPGWAADLITNPKAWAPDEDAVDDESDDRPVEPPRAGWGSGKAVWVAYAEACDVEIDEDDTRAQIIEKLTAAGKVAGDQPDGGKSESGPDLIDKLLAAGIEAGVELEVTPEKAREELEAVGVSADDSIEDLVDKLIVAGLADDEARDELVVKLSAFAATLEA